MGEPAKLRLKVRHYEVDEYDHVNHANYVHYLEVARIETLETVGLSLAEMRRQGYLIVAADLAVKYHSSARSGDTLEVVTHIREMRGARSVWVQEIREVASHRLVATAEVTGAFTTEGGRPVRIPTAFRGKLAAIYIPDTRSSAAGEDGRSPSGVKSRAVTHYAVDRHGEDRPSHTARPWCLCRGGGLRQTLRVLAGMGR